jgi:hypothetical protein
MPAVKENPSHILEDGYHFRESSESAQDEAFEKRLRSLQEPEKSPPIQSLRELWQVIVDVVKETRKARVSEESDDAPKATLKPL